MGVVVAVQSFTRHLPVTGDEPSYVYFAYSLFAHHDLSMPAASFYRAFPTLAWVPIESLRSHEHPVLFALLASPLVGWFGIGGARLASLVVGLIGLAGVRGLVAEMAGDRAAFAVSAFVFVTFPVVAYLHLFYTDILSLAVIAWAWRLARAGSGGRLIGAAVLTVCLPFVHVRTSLVAAGLFVLILRRAVAGGRGVGAGGQRLLVGILSIALVAGVVFIRYQMALFGSVAGGASSVSAVSLGGFFWQTGVQLLDFRHGLVTVNPAMILALAGLAIGVVRRSGLAIEACWLLGLYVVSFVWGAASESYPARFWVPIMPAMAVGLCVWLREVRSRAAMVAGGVLAGVALLNLGLHAHDTMAFLSNRQASLTYDAMFGWFPYLDFAGLFPWDGFDFSQRHVAEHMELSRALMVDAAWSSGLMVAAFAVEACVARFRRFIAVLPAASLVLPIWSAAMRPVPAGAMQIVRSRGEGGQDGSIAVDFCGPVDAAVIRVFGHPRGLMEPPAYPAEFVIEETGEGAGAPVSAGYPTSPVIALPHRRVWRIRLSGKTDAGHRDWVEDEVQILAKGGMPACGAGFRTRR